MYHIEKAVVRFDFLIADDPGMGIINLDPDIDTRKDCVSRNPVDVRIPLDYDVAMKIFRDKKTMS